MELDEWSLPTEAMVEYGKVIEKLKESPEGEPIRRFIKGGFWRNFFAKYPESNDLHKRVLYLGDKIRKAKRPVQKDEDLLMYLYRAECNDAYWHGVFGGLYLPHLRHALYENLIKAENLNDQEIHRKKEWVDLEKLDLNGDGDEELILKNPEAVLLFSSRGGSLLEMDYRPKAFNILETLTRREEGYHRKLLESRSEKSEAETRTIHEIFDSKENDLDRHLHFDQYRRASFLDHFISESGDFESFRSSQHIEKGDFIKELYEVDVKRRGGNQEILFSRLGKIWQDGKEAPIKVEKRFVPSSDRSVLKANYRIAYLGEEKKRANFGIEFNINLLAGDAPDRYFDIPGLDLEDRKLASVGELENISEVRLIDEWTGVKVILKVDKKCDLWRFPVETVSLSESGFEKIFQGSCLLFYWPLALEPKGEFEVSIELGVYPL
jgi:alpha-amylase